MLVLLKKMLKSYIIDILEGPENKKNKVKIGRRQNLAIEAAQMSSQRKILC
jgi:hypothetical protein